MLKGQAACRSDGRKIRVQRNIRASGGNQRRLRTARRVRYWTSVICRRSAAEEVRGSRRVGHPGKAKLRANVSRKRTRGLNDTRLNLHLLRFAVHLANQII